VKIKDRVKFRVRVRVRSRVKIRVRIRVRIRARVEVRVRVRVRVSVSYIMTIWRWEKFSRCGKFPTTPAASGGPQRYNVHGVPKMTKLVLSELGQICTKFDIFWQTESQSDKIM